jgi:GMP synthase (glutamine-hydrolysing)
VKVVFAIHQEDVGPGVFAEAARDWEVEEWWPASGDPPPSGFDALIAFGGGMHVDQEDEHPWLVTEKKLLVDLLEREVPLLAVCLGAQLLGEAAGAPARRSTAPEIGWYDVELTREGREDPVMGPLAPAFIAFEWHSYECPLPPGAVPLAGSEMCLQAFRIGDRAWAIQFHAEVSAADAESWIRHYSVDPDAVRIGIDPKRLWAESKPRLAAWNELGRGLATRFLAAL